jgi:hypothetical protein
MDFFYCKRNGPRKERKGWAAIDQAREQREQSNQISRRSDRISQTSFLPFLSINRDLLKKLGQRPTDPQEERDPPIIPDRGSCFLSYNTPEKRRQRHRINTIGC